MCAHSLEVGLGRLEGVQTVTAELNTGRVTVVLKEKNRVTVDAAKEVVDRYGFTLEAARVHAVGTVSVQEGHTAFMVRDTKLEYRLRDHQKHPGIVERLRREAGALAVEVSGEHRWPPKPKKDEPPEPPTLEVQRFKVLEEEPGGP